MGAVDSVLKFVAALSRFVWQAIVTFWSTPIRAEPLALCRIISGVVLIANVLLGVAPNLDLFWLPDAMLPLEIAHESAKRSDRFSLILLFPSAPAVIAMLVIWVLALALMTVGFFTRTSALIAFVMAVSFNMRGIWALNGGDDVAAQLLFYLTLAPAGAAWSIDSLRRRIKRYRDPERGFELINELELPKPAMIPPWSVRLMQIQLVLIYFLNGVNKFYGPFQSDYINGDALYWILHDTTLIRWSYDQFPIPLIFCRLAGWITLLFELGFPFLILWSRVRPWLLIVGVLFHAAIFIFMEIGWFGQNTLGFYPVFLSGVAVAAFAGWLAGKGKRGSFTLYYDTFCPICRRSRLGLALFDVGQRITFRDIHDRRTMQAELPSVSYQRALKEMIVRTPRGKVLGGFDAFRAVARVFPALWPILPVLYVPGVGWIGRRIYRWVASNRYRLSKCHDGVCSLHLQALQKKNLDESEIVRVVNNARCAAGFAPIEHDSNES